jgi:uncharacterized membrane protein YfcA
VSTTLTLALLLGTGIGLVLGMLGGGGAVLAVPVFVSILGQDVHAATTGSLVVVGLAALVGGVRQARGGHVWWRVAAVLALAALPAVTLGTVANVHASGSLLVVLLASLILGVAVVTWRRTTSARVPRGGEHRLTCPQIPLWKLLGAGVVLGVLTGFFGVGGGFVIVPMLSVACGVPLRLAIGTSLIAIFLMSVAGFANHLAQGSDVDWALVLPFAVATIAGSLAGATLSPRVPRLVLGRMFAVLLTGVALLMLVGA